MAKRLCLAILFAVILACGISLIRPQSAQCTALCQCCYCDKRWGGVCLVNGAPSPCIGCVGNCTGVNSCQARPGLGGCGMDIVWCRNSDCAPPPGPGATPTPTPKPPSGCTGEWTVVKQPGATWEYKPPFPVVIGQDPTVRGFDLLITAQGGWAERRSKTPVQVCDNGAGTYPANCPGASWHWVCEERVLVRYNDPIAQVRLTMDLAASSRAWINGELAARYPGAHIKEKFPWEEVLFSGNAMSVYIPFEKYPAEDPGYHEGYIILRSVGTAISPPQVVEVPYRVPVHLIDTTIEY